VTAVVVYKFANRNYCRPNVFDIQLRTMTECTWNILNLDGKTGIFFIQMSGNPVNSFDCFHPPLPSTWVVPVYAGEFCP